MAARLKFYGWGREGEGMTPDEERTALARYAALFGQADFVSNPVPRPEDITLSAPRVSPPASLAGICSADHYERLAHTYGKSYPDTVKGMLRDFANAPDQVAFPRSDAEVAAVLDWAGSVDASVTPFGGGSSVVGGVEPLRGPKHKAAISLDLRQLDQVVEVDKASRAARIQGGAFGPALEAQLKPHGVTLRHFPQSFEYSTLGGWIATRGGGHFATLYTHIDDFVENLTVVTPAGKLETRRLPGDGAGPAPERMFIGSEGTLGVITEAWMRVQDRPRFRAGGGLRFKDLYTAAKAVRALAQAGLYPSNCRVLDPAEAQSNGAGDGSFAVLVLAFESGDHTVDAWMTRALECCRDFGGVFEAEGSEGEGHRAGAAGQWRNAFIRMPYGREKMVPRGIIFDTFETAITWDRFEGFHAKVEAATADAIRRVTGKPGLVSCRFTHAYPDGPAPYFSFHALGTHGKLLEQWQAIKDAASDALIDAGGTITHHHAVGRDHRRWYDRQRPELFAAAMKAAKRTLDPKGLLNPGVLFDA
jgi:alkyldihydroxyacetonephosphate synthase